jgi:hypothetical protein
VSTGLGRDRLWITITGLSTGALGSYDGGVEHPARADALLLHSTAFDLEVGLDESIVVDGLRTATLTGFQHAEVATPTLCFAGMRPGTASRPRVARSRSTARPARTQLILP